jgi:hypothetical protein
MQKEWKECLHRSLRKAVQDDDFDTFRRGTPKGLKDADAQAVFDAVRTGMGSKKKKVKESYKLWEIAPRDDQQRTQRELCTRD